MNSHSHATPSPKDYLLIIVISLCVFLPFLGSAHLFDWDEANFAEAAREMLLTGNWLNPQIDFQLFWEKPPLFIWLQAISMDLFGISEFSARLPNAVIGSLTLCVLFYVGNRVADKKTAWWWVVMYFSSWLCHFYFKSAIIDPLFNLLIFLSIYQLYNAVKSQKISSALYIGIFNGLAILTKGPVALLILGLCGLALIIIKRDFFILSLKQYLAVLLALLLTVGTWLGVDIFKNGLWFTETFLVYQYRLFSTQDAGHGGPWYYHPLVLMIGCFPASVFFLNIVTKKKYWQGKFNNNDFFLLMTLLFFIHLVTFSIVKTKIIHYSSLCYLPLTFWAAVDIKQKFSGKLKTRTWIMITGCSIGGLLGLAIALLPIAGQHTDLLKKYIQDPLVVGNLEASVHFHNYEIIIGALVGLTALSILFLYGRRPRAFLGMSLAHALLITITISAFTPRIEAISQGGAIGFYKKAHADNIPVFPVMMKSYAYLFYSEKQQPDFQSFPSNTTDALNDTTERPYYFVSKNIHKEQVLKDNPALRVVEERAGYVLYIKK